MKKPASYADAIQEAADGHLVHTDYVVECFVDPGNGNYFYVVINKDGEKIVVDKFAKIMDSNGIALPVYADRPLDAVFDILRGRVLKGVLAVLHLTDDPLVQALAAALRVDISEYQDLRVKLESMNSTFAQIAYIVGKYGSDRAQAIERALADAMLDGKVDPVEWKKIFDTAKGR